MSLSDYFVGFWKVLDCAPKGVSINPKGIQGTIFCLTKTGDVTWKIPEDAIPIPLFKCDTYEVVSKQPYSANSVLRFGVYKGHIIDCTIKTCEPYIGTISIYDGWCWLVCKKFKEILQEDPFELPFSFLPALYNSYFSDLTIIAKNNKEFKVHKCILKLSAPEINWCNKPTPLSNYPEDVVFAILHYLYAQCLPSELKETTVKNIIPVASQLPGLDSLVHLCQLYIRNSTLKKRIFSLVMEIQTCASQITDYFTNKQSSHLYSNLASDPAKLCFAVKNTIREAAVATSKLLVICDLYTKQRNELSKEEGYEIFNFAKSKIPVLLNQLDTFFIAVKTTFNNFLPSQRQELACYLVPEVETIFDTICSVLIKVKAVLEVMLAESEMEKELNSQKILENLEEYTDDVLLTKELEKLRSDIHSISNVILHLHQKKENFKLMSNGNKIRSIAKNLEQLMEELPILVSQFERFTSALGEKLEWNESQFCFKVGTCKMSEIIKKFIAHKESLQELLTEICVLVQRDSFSQSLTSLGLLDLSHTTENNSEENEKLEDSQRTLKQELHMDSFCVPPPAHKNLLSQAARKLLKSEQETDMIFEIVKSSETDCLLDNTEVVSAEISTNPNLQLKICKVAAHRVIVASRCDWFRRALLSGMQEDINRKIQVHNTSPYLFSLFLKYLYSGKVECLSLSVDQISELLLLSDRYELDPLKQVCEFSLKPHLDVDSVLYFYSMADKYNANILKNACEHFITEHSEVIDSELFEELPDTLQSEIYDIVICGKPHMSDTVFSDTSSNVDDIGDVVTKLHINSNVPTPDSDDMSLSQDFVRLELVLEQLREIVGEEISRSHLVEVILAADYDVNRALNFFYAPS